MKKLPLTLIPVSFFIIFLLLFSFIPKDADLISAKGDYLVGQALGTLTIVCLFIDLVRFILNKKRINK